MMRCGALRAVSARDRGSCGPIRSRPQASTQLIIGSRDRGSCGEIGGLCGSGMGFYGLGPHGSESPGAISPRDWPRLTLTLGCRVFGSVGSGLGFHVVYILIYTLGFVCGSFRGITQRGSLRGFHGSKGRLYYIIHQIGSKRVRGKNG